MLSPTTLLSNVPPSLDVFQRVFPSDSTFVFNLGDGVGALPSTGRDGGIRCF